jgi:hypothetical protein
MKIPKFREARAGGSVVSRTGRVFGGNTPQGRAIRAGRRR